MVPPVVQWAFEGDKGDPDATVDMEVRDGRPEVVKVTVSASPQGRPVRTSDLERLQLDNLVVSTYSSEAMRWRLTDSGAIEMTPIVPVLDQAEFWRAVNEATEAVKAPRRGVTPAELEQVAQIYREHLEGQPLQAVLSIMGYGSQRTAARRVQQARDAGLLPSTTPGKRRA